MVKHVTDTALRANFALGLGKALTHIAEGTVGVIGETIDYHHASTRAKALVTRCGEIFVTTALGLTNGFFNDVCRHLVFLCAIDNAA